MLNTFFAHRLAAATIALPLIGALAACNIKTEEIPPVVGPSEFGLSLTLAAAPDTVSRDGSSQSVVTVTARDAQSRPVPGQRLALSLTPGNAGSLSAIDVVTGPDGRATSAFTAPPSSTTVDVVAIVATPVGGNFDNAVPRSMSIRLLGPAAPSPSFTIVPNAPERGQLVTFDASATTINGGVCGDACTYAWKFGNEQTATGRVVSYRFQAASTHVVELAVTGPSGGTATTTQSVVVSAALLAPVITYSPMNPRAGVDEVIFDGRSSTASGGATVADYLWDFGDGDTATGARVGNTFPTGDRIYTVRLTVRDSFGRTETTTTNITVRP